MAECLFGLETEYGIASRKPHAGQTERDALAMGLLTRAHDSLPGIPDFSSNGMFLQNGARFYSDCGHHPEMTTPEVTNPWDSVRYVLAGERILARLAQEHARDPRERPLLLKTNVDYGSQTTWGTHESYLHGTDPRRFPAQILPHLVSRTIYTGAGGFDPYSPGIEFVLSPRAMFMKRPTSDQSTMDRGIFHIKDESLSLGRHRRLHVIAGESLCSEIAMWLRSATTALIVAMVNGGLRPGSALELQDPLSALWTIVADPSCRATVVAGGREMTAIDIQRRLLEMAEEHVSDDFMPPWTEQACKTWRWMLGRLEEAPDSVSATLDWAIKRALFGRLMARRGFDWSRAAAFNKVLVELLGPPAARRPWAESRGCGYLAPAEIMRRWTQWDKPPAVRDRITTDQLDSFLSLREELFECDLRFGQLDTDAIFTSLDRAGVLAHHVAGVEDIDRATEHPPEAGRAKLRGEVIRRVLDQRATHAAGWQFVLDLAKGQVLDLSDPFTSEERWAPAAGHPIGRTFAGPPFRPDPFAVASPLERRAQAHGCLMRGDCEGAEIILQELLFEHFDTPGTHCHLARLYLVMGRDQAARHHVTSAWGGRAEASRYVLGRTLWFLLLLAFLDGADTSIWLGRLRTLGLDERSAMDWDVEPVLETVRPRISADAYEMLSALAAALSGRGGELRQRWWIEAKPVPML